MDKKEIVMSMFDNCYEFHKYDELGFSFKEVKMVHLCNDIIGYTTYDDNLSKEIGFRIFEVMKVIRDKTNFKYIEDKRNYKNYIFVVNLIKPMLDWGSSVRGAWFDYFDGKLYYSECLSNIGYDEEFIQLDKEFMTWFLDWLEN